MKGRSTRNEKLIPLLTARRILPAERKNIAYSVIFKNNNLLLHNMLSSKTPSYIINQTIHSFLKSLTFPRFWASFHDNFFTSEYIRINFRVNSHGNRCQRLDPRSNCKSDREGIPFNGIKTVGLEKSNNLV